LPPQNQVSVTSQHCTHTEVDISYGNYECSAGGYAVLSSEYA